MPFRSGLIGFRRFRVIGDAPAAPDEVLFARLAEHLVRPSPIGQPEERVSGFCGGRHVFDGEFAYDSCGFGPALLAAVRIDTAKVPSEIRQAYRVMAEDARRASAGEGMPGLSRAARKEAREDAEERCRRDLAEGKYRRMSMVPFLWDLPEGTLFAPISSDAALSEFKGLFDAGLGLRLEPRAAGSIARDLLGLRGRTAVLEDALPDALTARPDGASSDQESPRGGSRPDVPWALAGGEPLDFLGNLFLLWLWWRCERDEGVIETAGPTVAVVVDRHLEMECAWGVTGRQVLTGETPARSPEAWKALQAGKWPRKVGLVLAAHGQEFRCALQGDRFAVTGLKRIVDDDDDAGRSPREVLEQRIDALLTFDRMLLSLYGRFLEDRCTHRWESVLGGLRQWIADLGRPMRRGADRATRAAGEPGATDVSISREADAVGAA